MKVYRSLDEFTALPYAVVTQGTFDGVHLGHQKILKQLRSIADQEDGETVLLTFFPHPRLVLQPEDNTLKLLESLEEKVEHLEQQGIDHVLILPFTREFSRMDAEDFVRDILVNAIGTKVMVVGYDHRFGRNREGNFQELQRLSETYDFRVEEIAARDIDEVTVSSTKIRKALLSGDLETANAFLGYPYRVKGEVVTGHKKGKRIGFPTANIRVDDEYKLIPGDGVYAVEADVDGERFKGMANIGNQPTFQDRNHAFEVHLFHFSRDIYGARIEVIFRHRLRDEMKFESVEALRSQLEKDKFAALDKLSGR